MHVIHSWGSRLWLAPDIENALQQKQKDRQMQTITKQLFESSCLLVKVNYLLSNSAKVVEKHRAFDIEIYNWKCNNNLKTTHKVLSKTWPEE